MKYSIDKTMKTNSYEKTKELKRRLYAFVLRLIDVIDRLPRDTVTQRIIDQLIRSGTSILGTYIEGLSSSSRRDFINYLNHALKSANESKVWVAILRDTKRMTRSDADWLLGELEEFSKIFASSILTLKGKRNV